MEKWVDQNKEVTLRVTLRMGFRGVRSLDKVAVASTSEDHMTLRQ